MNNWWRWLGLLAAWWMGVFLVQRILFLAFAFRSLRAAPWPEILATNLHAIPMDLSAAGYILMASALLSSPLLFRELRWVRRGLVVWTLALEQC